MIRLRRRNTAWLVAMTALIGFALLAAPLSAAVQLALIGALVVAVIASMIELGPERASLLDTLNRAPVQRRRTPQAQEASERAAARAGYFNRAGIILLDIGLSISQTGAEGMVHRRTRSISKDDDGACPFVTLHVMSDEADRQAIVRYEIYNHRGEQQFVHEMKTYLREGEMDLRSDYQLPLAGNSDVEGSGNWDLRVYIDNSLIGMQNLRLSPSVGERRSRLASNADSAPRARSRSLADAVIVEEPEQPKVAKLEDLLRQPGERRSRPRRSR